MDEKTKRVCKKSAVKAALITIGLIVLFTLGGIAEHPEVPFLSRLYVATMQGSMAGLISFCLMLAFSEEFNDYEESDEINWQEEQEIEDLKMRKRTRRR